MTKTEFHKTTYPDFGEGFELIIEDGEIEVRVGGCCLSWFAFEDLYKDMLADVQKWEQGK